MSNINIKIEIPKNSNIKYEYNRKNNLIEVDRILREGFKYPANYGFIPNTLDWDGDELDVLLYSSETFITGVHLNARIIGAMKMIDDGEVDTKIIAVHNDDYRLNDIKNLNNLPPKFLEDCKIFFSTYKNWKREGITKVLGFEDANWAQKEYAECIELMEKYGSLSKKEFIQKMKIEHKEKYID